MDQQPSSPQPLFTILGVSDATIFQSPGGAVRGKRVEYRAVDGTRSYVEVTLADFNQAKVADLITEEVQNLLEVKGTQGPTVILPG